jgi:glutaredoxin-related protein
VCEKVLDYTANIFFQFRNILPQSPPVYLAGTISSLANTIHTTLYCIAPEEREELLKYIFEWCDITPNAFEEELLKAAEIRYNHYNIIESMEVLTTFLRSLNAVWTKMNNLEYIGQRKENIVVKKEVVQQQAEPVKKRWSIID